MALLPGLMVAVAGAAVIEKSGVPFTTSMTAMVCVRPPLIPVTVRLLPPVGVFAAVVTVNVELVPPLIAAGMKEAVAPVGKPLILRLTEPLKLFSAPALRV